MLGVVPGGACVRSDGSVSSDDETVRSPRRTGSTSKGGALKKFSQSFKRKKDRDTARDLIPARYIRGTSVKPNTLNPVWNEKFRVYVVHIMIHSTIINN